MTPITIAVAILALLLVSRRTGAAPMNGAAMMNGGPGGSGALPEELFEAQPFPFSMPSIPGAPALPMTEVVGVLRPAACSIYSPPGECLPWGARPPGGGELNIPAAIPALPPRIPPVALAPEPSPATLIAYGPVPGTTVEREVLGGDFLGGSRHPYMSAQDPRVF